MSETGKFTGARRSRAAVLYVRQSTLAQVEADPRLRYRRPGVLPPRSQLCRAEK
jgi:hypothetical protein